MGAALGTRMVNDTLICLVIEKDCDKGNWLDDDGIRGQNERLDHKVQNKECGFVRW